MSLNIKREETYRLAQELAKLTGESVTDAVTKAVQERLDEHASDRVARDRMVTAQRHGLERARAQASALGAQAAHAVDPETARRLRRASIIAAYNARHLEHELAR